MPEREPKVKAGEDLADFVRRVRAEKGLTLNEVERLSGGMITNGYVSQIENGQVTKVSLPKLKALAKGLLVTEDEVLSAARGKLPTSEGELYAIMLDELKDKLRSADGKEKEFIESNLRMLLNEMDRRRRA